ncbi:MAG: NUDIX hydrolase [Solidesulfovibrio sp. DCME]|uniref:NUDIX hydrolase n=1 Tax=Solidesulfovibrio sp. DCME TaxID=3447380 RepID=UPI003D0A3F07
MAKKRPTGPSPELVDIVDATDRPLLVMPLAEAHRQGLFHRSVMVLVFNDQGKLYLQKRGPQKSLYPNRFDLSATGHVRAGESRQEAAARELQEELGLTAPSLAWLDAVPASEETAYEFVTLFTAGRLGRPPRPNPNEVAGGVFVDAAELAALVRDYRDLLTPAVIRFSERKVLFPV